MSERGPRKHLAPAHFFSLNGPVLHDRILISPSLEQTIISYYHNINYLGIKATQRFICATFLFKNTKSKIRDFVHACINCQRTKANRHIVKQITSIPMLNARFERINIDIAGPFPSSNAIHMFWFVLIHSQDGLKPFQCQTCLLPQSFKI